MANSVDLGNKLEAFVAKLVATGRYNSKSEVLREGVRLVQEREARLAVLGAALSRGLADADAGRVTPAGPAFAGLRAKYQAMAEKADRMKLVLTDEARADLARIADHIARDNPRRAITFVDEIEACCARIPKMPRAYPLVPGHEASGVRRAVHGNYLIFYRVEPGQVVVIHVLHGARDYEAILFPD